LTNGDLIVIEKGDTILLVMGFGYNINPYKTYSDNLAISDLYELHNSYSRKILITKRQPYEEYCMLQTVKILKLQ
jgi:hypothetical protein